MYCCQILLADGLERSPSFAHVSFDSPHEANVVRRIDEYSQVCMTADILVVQDEDSFEKDKLGGSYVAVTCSYMVPEIVLGDFCLFSGLEPRDILTEAPAIVGVWVIEVSSVSRVEREVGKIFVIPVRPQYQHTVFVLPGEGVAERAFPRTGSSGDRDNDWIRFSTGG